ncbi:MAG: Hsp33 family molecular chaperone HslO [Pseudomonadota bacterium]
MNDASSSAVAEIAPGDDSILPFQLDRAGMRGRVARLDRTLDEILGQHAYPAPVSALVAEAALLTALIGQAVKLRWRFSLQIRGDGPIRLIATDYFAPETDGAAARIRAYAGFDKDRLDEITETGTPISHMGRGVFGVTIDQGAGMTPYQGMTPLAGASLAACAETYFAQSEQLATRFAVEAALAASPGETPSWRGGGVMIQQLPTTGGVIPDAPSGEEGLMSADDVAGMGEREDDWARVVMLLETVETHELVGPHIAPETLLLRLFHEETPRVYQPQSAGFGCTCSAERVEAALSQYSAKDIAHMTTEDGRVTADCQFCGAAYVFDPSTLGFEATK